MELAGVRHGLDPSGCSAAWFLGPLCFFLHTGVHGCDKFCTFCIIPYRRGRETSRISSEFVHEAEMMVARGVKGVTFLGQNVTRMVTISTKNRPCDLMTRCMNQWFGANKVLNFTS
ncbi:MAG: hypothetical protein Ct9H300mP19_09570 [Dehalococcoidia bacterium]|nr:MAG: hypothetical protein Ct9H300mP19_09570 [Dehalococcoidia bacterium]